MTRTRRWAAVIGFVLLAGAAGGGMTSAADLPSWSYRPLGDRAAAPPQALPALPDSFDLPIQLVLDDDGAEGAFGVSGVASRQFLWFQQFAAVPSDFELEEVWVLFPPDPQLAVGAPVQIVVYRDDDADPTNGAELLHAEDVTVQAVDGVTFSVYPLAPPVSIRDADQVLIGVVNRYVTSGVTPPSQPAAIDEGSAPGRAWVATWTGDPPDPPELPSDGSTFGLNQLVPGVWMIRGFGTRAPVVEVPALGPRGLAALAALLAALGMVLARRA